MNFGLFRFVDLMKRAGINFGSVRISRLNQINNIKKTLKRLKTLIYLNHDSIGKHN